MMLLSITSHSLYIIRTAVIRSRSMHCTHCFNLNALGNDAAFRTAFRGVTTYHIDCGHILEYIMHGDGFFGISARSRPRCCWYRQKQHNATMSISHHASLFGIEVHLNRSWVLVCIQRDIPNEVLATKSSDIVDCMRIKSCPVCDVGLVRPRKPAAGVGMFRDIASLNCIYVRSTLEILEYRYVSYQSHSSPACIWGLIRY